MIRMIILPWGGLLAPPGSAGPQASGPGAEKAENTAQGNILSPPGPRAGGPGSRGVRGGAGRPPRVG